jgi:hypothetical protein
VAPLIITTNLARDALFQRYGERVASRVEGDALGYRVCQDGDLRRSLLTPKNAAACVQMRDYKCASSALLRVYGGHTLVEQQHEPKTTKIGWACRECSARAAARYLYPPKPSVYCTVCGAAMSATEQIAAALAWLAVAPGIGHGLAQLAGPAVNDDDDQRCLQRRHRKPVDSSKQLLTQVDAARELGVDRRTTLADLIADGQLTTVPGPRGRPRIPRSEVERLVQTGIPARGQRRTSPRRASRAVKRPTDVGAAIRALPVT